MAKKKKRSNGVLVPVDFSPTSVHVVAQAVQLADAMDRPLTILHVVHDPGDAPGSYHVKGRKKLLNRAEDVAQEMMEDFLAQSRQKYPESKAMRQADSLVVVGLPVSRILEVVDRLEPWMVVMGSAGRTGLARVMLGSKAEQVLRLCPVPVTIVKSPPEA